MTLKTLKEIIKTDCCTVCATILKGSLEKEAIKIIKDLKKNNRFNAILAFEKFFNITSEELK